VSLRWRLNLLVASLNLVFLISLLWLMVDNHRESIREEIEATHRITVQMLGSAAKTSPVFGPAAMVMTGFLQSLGRVRANEIRLYSNDGQLRYVSPPSTYKAGRSAPAWFESLMRPTLNATIIGLQGARIEVLPDASRAILDAWDTLAIVVQLGLGFVAVLHTALLFLLRHLLQPTEADARRLVATTQELERNREVTRLIQAGVEEERKRLSRELHDELGQSVTAIRLIATSLARGGGSMPLAEGSAKINEIAAGLYDSVHRIVRELRPAVLEQRDLAAAVQDQVREWRAHHPGIAVELVCQGDLGDLGEQLVLVAFRCIQEALTNVLKHSAANQVRLALIRGRDVLELTVENDGSGGGSGDLGTSSHGLLGMRERVVAVGGTMETTFPPEGGFRVSIRLPVSGGIE
jgi:two-component system sensor histidine kinase UhpB